MTGRIGRRDEQLSLRRIDSWITLGLVVLVCATLAWSLDDALLVLGRGSVTDFLFWAALGGVLVGFIGPTIGWSRWTTHLLGAVYAAVIVPLLVGWVLIPDGAAPNALFQATTDSVVVAWSDLVLAGRLSTFAFGHHLLVLGLVVWGSAQFASYAAFGHRRPLNAVVVIGLLLLANMSLTVRDQLLYLVIFSIASLFLLVRFHTLDEQADWLRRRIGDPSAISTLYLRGGTVFIIAAISGSLLLTNVAASAPLAGAWNDMGARFIEWSQAIERFLPPSRTGRSVGPSFGDTARIGTTWSTDDGVAMTMTLAPTEQDIPYLAAAIYDTFQLGGWVKSEGGTSVAREPGAELLTGTGDEVSLDTHRIIDVTISPAVARREIFLPGRPDTVDQPVTLGLIGESGYLTGIEREPSSSAYTMTTLVPATEAEGGPTEARLRAAGQDYPPEIVALYGKDTVPEGALGPRSLALLQELATASPGTTPYDYADSIRDFLRDPQQFRYDTDLSDEPCSDPSIVECFVTTRVGFCEYYASTMAIYMRQLGIPARFVEGFLPGQGDARTGIRTIRNNNAHAWVQVYFPGFGWVDFDPTGGSIGQLAPIPSGDPENAGSPGPSGSGATRTRPPEPADPSGREEPNDGGAIGSTNRNGSAGPLIAVGLLLLIVTGAIAAVAWQRGPRGPVSADGVYGSVTRLATRLGFGPRPHQTVYEYAGSLADALPVVRPELETVARAKVEVVYGGQVLGEDRLLGLRQAQRRLRVNLLRLALRRTRRGRRR